jgi:hypothetical protein
MAGDACAGAARNFAGATWQLRHCTAAMLSADREIALLMIEAGLLQVDQTLASAPMLGVAGAALGAAHAVAAAVESGFRSRTSRATPWWHAMHLGRSASGVKAR